MHQILVYADSLTGASFLTRESDGRLPRDGRA